MKIQELIKDLEAMQDEGMTEVKIMDLEHPTGQVIDHVTLFRDEQTVLLVTWAAASADS